MPVLGDSLRKVFEVNLADAERKYHQDKTVPEHIIWYGRRLAYLGRYKEAIDVYTEGIRLFPANARFYRHRGHRYITLRCFDLAIADLKQAAELVRGQIDEMEEDGLPNAMNIPVSSLKTNIYYHLGLAYYLENEYRNALLAFERCADLSDNDDMMIAAINWINIILRKSGRSKEADERIKDVHAGMEIIENNDYLDILLMYKTGRTKSIAERTARMENLGNATLGFGLATYYQLKGREKKAREILIRIVDGNQWSSFGFIAAEKELGR